MARKSLALGTTAAIEPAKSTQPARVLPDQTGTVGPAAPVLRTASAVPGGLWADRTAAKLADDDTFGPDMIEAWEADETSKKKVVQVLFDLRAIFGEEELDAFPQLTPKLKELPAGSNLFIDEYATTKKNKEGKDVPGTGSRYDDLARKLPWVVEAQKLYNYFKAAKLDRTKAAEEHVAWANSMFDTEIEKQGRRVRNSISMIRDAMRVHFQMRKVNNLPMVGCALQTIGLRNPDGTPAMIGDKQRRALVAAASPITVFSHTERDPDTNQIFNTAMSSGAFLQLNVEKAILKAGGADKVTFAILIASAGRQTEPAATQTPRIKSIEDFESTMAEVSAFLEQDHNATRLRSMIAGKDKSGAPLMSDQYVLTIQKAFVVLETIVSIPEFMGRAKVLGEVDAAREAQARKAAAQGTVRGIERVMAG